MFRMSTAVTVIALLFTPPLARADVVHRLECDRDLSARAQWIRRRATAGDRAARSLRGGEFDYRRVPSRTSVPSSRLRVPPLTRPPYRPPTTY